VAGAANGFRALVFDVDGTLAETEELHRRAFNEIFAAFGLDWEWDPVRYRELLRVTGGKERIRAYAETLGTPLDEGLVRTLHAAKTQRYAQLVAAGELALRPGIRELVEAGRGAGMAIGVATTTNLPNVEALTRATWGRPATEVFDVIAAGDMVRAKKPAPDVYRLALDELGLAGHEVIAFEDSRNGLLAARGAHIPCVIAPSPWTLGQRFDEAALVVDEFSECLPLSRLLTRVSETI